MRRRTKIQKLKKALPGIIKDVRHYAKPRVKLHNEGLGDYYTEGYRSLNQREWKGVKDTAYDFASWLKVYGYMAVTLGKHPVALTRSFMRYPWMASYLTVANMLDRHKLGLRGKQLRYTQEQFYGVVHNSVDVIAKIIERDENLNSPHNKRAAKLRAKTVMFDEMTPSIIMAGFPMLDWIDIAMSPVCLPGEVDQNANITYQMRQSVWVWRQMYVHFHLQRSAVRSWTITHRWEVLLLQVPCHVTGLLERHCLWIVI